MSAASAARPCEKGVSIVVPCRNDGRYLADRLDAACAQVPVPHDVVVVDDEPTDDTQSVLAACRGRVEVVTTPAAVGPGAARNTKDRKRLQ